MSQQKKDTQAPKAEMLASRLRLKRAREAAGKMPEDLGELVGNTSTYYDLENHDGELYSVPSLRELSRLCFALGTKVRDLFDDRTNVEPAISPEQLLSEAKEYLSQNRLSIAEFEDRIGFEIGPSLNDTSNVMDWNVDFLRWLCRELGLDWRLALP
jgi:transcriptional regulator with XRE-family HTH domain